MPDTEEMSNGDISDKIRKLSNGLNELKGKVEELQKELNSIDLSLPPCAVTHSTSIDLNTPLAYPPQLISAPMEPYDSSAPSWVNTEIPSGEQYMCVKINNYNQAQIFEHYTDVKSNYKTINELKKCRHGALRYYHLKVTPLSSSTIQEIYIPYWNETNKGGKINLYSSQGNYIHLRTKSQLPATAWNQFKTLTKNFVINQNETIKYSNSWDKNQWYIKVKTPSGYYYFDFRLYGDEIDPETLSVKKYSTESAYFYPKVK